MNGARLLHRVGAARVLLAVLVAALATGCAQVPREPLVHQPMTARAESYAQMQPRRSPGAIFQDGPGANALFEDRRPRNIGDILTIVINEKVNATKNSGANASRAGNTTSVFAAIPKLIGGLLDGQDTKLSGTNSLTAKGGANANNTFSGVITVTVVDVMGNGNLLVSGEKQMGINQGTEYIRFSGVVNPRTVSGNNTVPSTLVADARIEYSAKGYIDEAQTMGWMQRIFLNVMPF
ncbi:MULTISPECIES: flagellar basal body L-ring protein FlgH [Variovorax]|jgi:flagellar L-ring protein FlgH|uniref:flagellar basal body L-ring protein FlgH n=1 Tax=Variovorax TaxID=34072 RepID=UPI00086F561B|nr:MULTISPECIES: flagellar basal body L-ring protein FlgH [Variovorax]MBN8757266.1 flagellar basal body L-ring protein FlgH [Variovorax sp.]ODU13769.1 MAG: flagellar basal body L-ring protein [Variovorax sp. SCN 67-85]ODV20700.1 MAG: flagellar basal body L-ring protein [Variovorax sp. SCN 67-20]OJZ13667.1 MAG: flagellar basal body L-ring protein [Variovorax sp. 67-131]UKI06322.1 flagellar basal body L-ring protein FlgH [Variovorax paradoxus]